MVSKKQITYFFILYAALRIFSYFFQPRTPLHGTSIINTSISGLILLITIYFLCKKNERAWYIVALEIILGGAAGFLAVGPLSLRTCLLVSSLGIYFPQQIRNTKFEIFKQNKTVSALLFFIFAVAIFSTLRGLYFHHDKHQIFADMLPYIFFWYYFPLQELLRSEKFKQLCINAFSATIIGNGLFILLTFVGFSSGHFILQDAYYHWYRDVALGKITELPFHFYRLVLNEHLLLIPILLWLLWRVIARSEERTTKQSPGLGATENRGIATLRYAALAMTLLAVLAINLSRSYLLALIVGLLFLFSKQHWKRWLAVSIFSFFFFLFSFTTLHLIASRGQSLGWELFGLRLQSILSPELEDSSLSRMLLLPKILEKIKLSPVLGQGFGDTVTVYSPVLKQTVTTNQFDWGYLEIVDEMGIVGLIIWILNIGYWVLGVRRNITHKQFYLASLVSLLVINLTSPALFHVLGIVWLTFLFSSLGYHPSYDDQIR